MQIAQKVTLGDLIERFFTVVSFYISIFLQLNYYIRCVKSARIRSYSGPHFPAFGLNTERYRIQEYLSVFSSNAEKCRSEKCIPFTQCKLNQSPCESLSFAIRSNDAFEILTANLFFSYFNACILRAAQWLADCAGKPKVSGSSSAAS